MTKDHSCKLLNIDSPNLNRRLKLKYRRAEVTTAMESNTSHSREPDTKDLKWKKTREFLQNALTKDGSRRKPNQDLGMCF